MGCPTITSGSSFLATTLAHLDCQGKTIGAYGYASLAQPGSSVSIALTGLLTLFVALYGIRLMLTGTTSTRDLVGGVIRVGIVLTLAGSWPAWRVVGYDVVMSGPQQLAGTLGRAADLSPAGRDLPARLQVVDDGLVVLTSYGTGRLVGGADPGDAFRGVVMPDYIGLGWGRVVFLVNTIAPYAMLRLGSGILLALAPLMAGLLLFSGTMPLFLGWLRGLVFCALGSLAYALVQSAQLAVLEPWLGDILRSRAVNGFTPSAPTELLVIAMAFCLAIFGLLGLIGWISFASPAHFPLLGRVGSGALAGAAPAPAHVQADMRVAGDSSRQGEGRRQVTRAQVVADAVAANMRREQAGAAVRGAGQAWPSHDDWRSLGRHAAGNGTGANELLGNSFRRGRQRVSAAGTKRDAGS